MACKHPIYHQSIYIRDESDGALFAEKYLTKEYVYDYVPGGETGSDWIEFTTDKSAYYNIDGEYVRYLSVTPDGLSDFASYRAERYTSILLSEDAADEIIESVSKKDGRIVVTSVLSQKILEDLAADGVTSGKLEYTLDTKTHEITSLTGDYAYGDDLSYHITSKVSYDTEVPEMVKAFLKYENQTEDLRTITVVSNPGTEKEESKTVQVPKGLIIGLRYDEDSAYQFDPYTDAACTEIYDPYANTDSDLTIYVKWDK